MSNVVLFESYERDFAKVFTQVTRSVNTFHLAADHEIENRIQTIKRQLTEVEHNLKQMESIFTQATSMEKSQLQNKVRKYRTEFDDIRKKFFKAEEGWMDKKAKADLMRAANNKGLINGLNNGTIDAREKIGEGIQKLGNMSNKIDEYTRVAVETENMGKAVSNNLREQREVIIRANAMNQETDQYLNRTDKILALMRNKEMFNKAILFMLIFVLGLADLCILYAKITRQSNGRLSYLRTA